MCNALLNTQWVYKKTVTSTCGWCETSYHFSFFFLAWWENLLREGLGRPALALALKQQEKKKCQAVINKNASYWEWTVLPGKKKKYFISTPCERNKWKKRPNCSTEVLTYIHSNILNLKIKMTHFLFLPSLEKGTFIYISGLWILHNYAENYKSFSITRHIQISEFKVFIVNILTEHL